MDGAPRLWTFHGGLHLPDEKALASERPIEPLPLPPRLAVPLGQHVGARADVCVRVGERVLKGQLLGRPAGRVSAAVHAPSSGRVIAIEDRPVPHPSGLSAPCVLIETDGEDAWIEPLPPLDDYRDLDPALVQERIRACGVVGLGGAAFPTSVKLSTGAGRPIDTLVVNGAECEPYIACDDRLMRERPRRILDGIAIVRHLVGARRVLIGIEDNKPAAVAALSQALAASDLQDSARVVAIPTRYPSGGERQLIRILTGLEVPSGGLPAELGVVCHGVGTAAAVAEAVLDGRPLIARIVTVSGRAVARAANLEVRLGTPLSALIAQCGGYRERPRQLVLGGPMMGFAIDDLSIPVAKTANCLLALTAAESPEPPPARPCIRCGRCAEVCPASLLPQQLYWHARARDLERAQAYHLFDCIECGCCSQVCPSQLPLVQYYRFAKNAVRAQRQEQRQAELARARFAARASRLARQEAERQARRRRGAASAVGDAPSAPDRDAP